MDPLETSNLHFVEPSVTLLHESDPFKMIELAGRTCYKSEDKITQGSAVKFVKALLRNQHFAMIEHAALVFQLECEDKDLLDTYAEILDQDPYIRVTFEPEHDNRVLVSADVRAIIQRNLYDPIYKTTIEAYPDFDISVEHEPSIDDILKNVSAKIVNIKQIKDLTHEEFMNHFFLSARFITDRGVTHEMCRHRPFSFAQESTRYCNYSKDKFGGHVTFCKPTNYNNWSDRKKEKFIRLLETVDDAYQFLVEGDDGLTPQDARSVLTTCLKTEVVITGPAMEWQHFFNLRSKGVSGAPHPDIKYVADIAKTKMNNYLYSLKFDEKHHF